MNLTNLRFAAEKDPMRYPKIQRPIEDEFKSNFSKSLKVIQVQIIKTLTKHK